MALSNIFREPLREIIETVAGIAFIAAAVILFVWIDGYFARWFVSHSAKDPDALTVGYLLGFFAVVFLLPIAVFVHFVGEEVCDWLRRRNLDPRPKQRY